MLRELLEWSREWTYVINLTGSDYPLRTQHEIAERFSEKEPFYNYIWFVPYDEESAFKRDWIDSVWMDVNDANINTLVVRTDKPAIPFYFCSWNFQFSRQFVSYLINSPEAFDLYGFSRQSHIPEEFVWATVLLNSKYNTTAVRNNYRYERWKAPCSVGDPPGVHPCLLSVADFAELTAAAQNKAIFAGKFDLERKESQAVLDLIDEKLLRVSDS